MLKEHNIPVYEQFEEMLLREKECILITATGTGKSYVTMEFIKRYNLKTLVICPKRSICESWDGFKSPNVTAITYHKFHINSSIFTGFDCYVFDEAHHMGGSKWKNTINSFRKCINAFFIGLTADSKRYSDGGKDVADIMFNNNIVYGYDRAKAIELGILPSATYVCALYNIDEFINEVKCITTELDGRLDIARKNTPSIINIMKMHMPQGTRKGIIFVDSISNINNGANIIKNAFPKSRIYCIHSKMKKEEIREELSSFRKCKSGYIVAVDMMNEGLHIDGVNTIVMLRKTASPSIYNQQIGRCLSSTSIGNTVIFDFVANYLSLDIRYVENAISSLRLNTNKPINISNQIIVKDYLAPFLEILRIANSRFSHYTEYEDNILIKNFNLYGSNKYSINECMKELPHRSYMSIQNRFKVLGLKNSRIRMAWTPESDAALIEKFNIIGRDVIYDFENRSESSIKNRLNRLGLISKTLDRWTQEEENLLSLHYPNMGMDVYKVIPGKTKSQCASKARKMGLFTMQSWSSEKLDKLRQLVSDGYNKIEIAHIMNKTPRAIESKLLNLGISIVSNPKSKKIYYTEEQDAIIKEFYPEYGAYYVSKKIGRTVRSINRRAIKLGVRYLGKPYNSMKNRED